MHGTNVGGGKFVGDHVHDVSASGWQMSGWSKYIECIVDGETKGLVKKQMIYGDCKLCKFSCFVHVSQV